MSIGPMSGVILSQALKWGTCDSGMGASTTVIVCAELAGFGNDYFNSKFYMQVIRNTNSVGNAPENQIRNITDYVTATGTFTCDAFGANVEEDDIVMILHESLVEIMNKDGSFTFDKATDSLEAVSDKITALNNVSTAQVNTEVDNALDTAVPLTPTANSLNDILSKLDGANTYDNTTDSLEAIADAIAAKGTGATLAQLGIPDPDNRLDHVFFEDFSWIAEYDTDVSALTQLTDKFVVSGTFESPDTNMVDNVSSLQHNPAGGWSYLIPRWQVDWRLCDKITLEIRHRSWDATNGGFTFGYVRGGYDPANALNTFGYGLVKATGAITYTTHGYNGQTSGDTDNSDNSWHIYRIECNLSAGSFSKIELFEDDVSMQDITGGLTDIAITFAVPFFAFTGASNDWHTIDYIKAFATPT